MKNQAIQIAIDLKNETIALLQEELEITQDYIQEHIQNRDTKMSELRAENSDLRDEIEFLRDDRKELFSAAITILKNHHQKPV